MAVLTVSTTRRGLVTSKDQHTALASAAITALQAVRLNTSGQWALTDASSAGTSTGVHIATRAALEGEALTAVREGVFDGFVLDDLDPGDPVYLSNDAGALADAAGDTSVKLGSVIEVDEEKLLKIEAPI